MAAFPESAFARVFEVFVRRPEQEQNRDGVEPRDINRGIARHVRDPHLERPKRRIRLRLLPRKEHARVLPSLHAAKERPVRLRPTLADAQHSLREYPQRNFALLFAK